ncbi:hypothetical protein AJ78_08861 [Emergomyces pasteurianus Ep9510]|uniref:Uncharacterized protein n=1 Tax=Emergomyces pasteurianus Ep9510 TaxID=1447872 RepID=A0A1J9P0P0_9EURO|nr:hypothetical protein AJ78_08861 [Emergomyces pasteurianus Ep9510]
MVAIRFVTYVQCQLRRAIRAGFQNPPLQLANLHLTPITIDIDDAQRIIDNFQPDVAFFEAGSPLNSFPNRCPGDLKVSWRWVFDWGTSLLSGERNEYIQVLSQVNFYIRHNARYGLILTDTELAISWDARSPERLTILLRLWYLPILGAADNE